MTIIALAASSVHDADLAGSTPLVATAGSYSPADFRPVRLPFTLIVMAVTVLLVPWLPPL